MTDYVTLKVPIEIQRKAFSTGGYELYQTYLRLALLELVKGIAPRVVPLPQADDSRMRFSVEIDLPPDFVKEAYK